MLKVLENIKFLPQLSLRMIGKEVSLIWTASYFLLILIKSGQVRQTMKNHIATGNYTVFATAISEVVDGDIDSMHFMLDTSFGKDKTARMSMHMRYDGIIDWAIIEGTCSGLCEGNCFRRLMMD